MTSTSFNIGLNETKNSSRVLKPPGGGHSDIFGINKSSEIITQIKKSTIPPSTINSCFFNEEIAKPKEVKNNVDLNGKTNENQKNDYDKNTQDENNEPSSKETEVEKKVQTPEPPKRVRVPPGGFSSGLW